MSSDLRPFVAEEIRLHPRVAYQGLLSEEGAATRVAAALPPLSRFRHDYAGAISIVDWITGCRRTAPRLQRLLVHLDDELTALEKAAGLS